MSESLLLGIMTDEIPSPGILKVFEGAIQVTEIWASSSETEPIGYVCI